MYTERNIPIMVKHTKADLQNVVDRIWDLCETWDKNRVYLQGDPKKLPIAPVYQFKDILEGYVSTPCECEEPKIGNRIDWAKPRCGNCGLFIMRD